MNGEAAASRAEIDESAREMSAAIARLAARVGETIASWGPVSCDAVTVARFLEAVGLPARNDADQYVPAIILAVIHRRPIDVHQDARPSEQVDKALGNPVNGGTRFEFLRPIRIGETVRGTVVLKEATLREGRSGPLAIVVKRTTYSNGAGEILGHQDHTMIYRKPRQ